MDQHKLKKRAILVIDDEEEFHELIRAIFADTHTVSGATRVDEALRMLRQTQFDVVLLDLLLPYRSGWEVLRALSSRPDAPPVIVITAVGDKQVRAQAEELGAVYTVVKPIVPRQLRKMVEYCETLKR